MSQVKRKRKKKEKSEEKLEFEPGKVFNPAEAKDEELDLDLEAGQYKAKKGEGGTRRT